MVYIEYKFGYGYGYGIGGEGVRRGKRMEG
jgi:hypothetical protein